MDVIKRRNFSIIAHSPTLKRNLLLNSQLFVRLAILLYCRKDSRRNGQLLLCQLTEKVDSLKTSARALLSFYVLVEFFWQVDFLKFAISSSIVENNIK
jgi:hypothetical protein